MPHPLSFAHYRDTPADRLALQLAGRTDIDVPLILRQVEGWQRLRHKVPRWADTEGVLFPPRLALEQCSG
ncbi:MAG: SAM-dependent methyltransferase, partial [Alloprevotella sp.]